MKVGIVAKRTEVFASSSVISSCVEFYYFSMSRRFQLFFFNHFDQFSRVVLDWQLSISPTCSSLLGYTIHSLTIYSHACSTPPQLRLQLHSCQSKDCKFGKESELRSFVVCAAAAAGQLALQSTLFETKNLQCSDNCRAFHSSPLFFIPYLVYFGFLLNKCPEIGGDFNASASKNFGIEGIAKIFLRFLDGFSFKGIL